MENNGFIIKQGKGKNTTLDREYSDLINQVISANNEEKENRWETYNMIIREIFEIDNGKYFQEIRYRLTDKENENNVILDIISRYAADELTYLLWFLKKRVEEYAEEDFFKRFYE